MEVRPQHPTFTHRQLAKQSACLDRRPESLLSNFYDVMSFQAKFMAPLVDVSVSERAAFNLQDLSLKLATFRLNFIHEELGETLAAHANRDLSKLADGLIDTVYVIYGLMALVNCSPGIPVLSHWVDTARIIVQNDALALPAAAATPPSDGEAYFQCSREWITSVDDSFKILDGFEHSGHLNLEQLDTLYRGVIKLRVAALIHAIPWQRCWEAVHAANMLKVPAEASPDGVLKVSGGLPDPYQVTKPVGWTPPNLERVLLEHGWAPDLSTTTRS